MSNPRISVVMSVYNGLPHLKGAVDSILGQTFSALEFIVIDDGSTDGSRELLRSYKDPRLKLIEQENTGLTKALIRGVSEARCDFVARQDADDVSAPERLARQLAMLEAAPAAVAIGCSIALRSPDGRTAVAQPIGNPSLYPWFNTFFNVFGGHGQMMFRRSAYDLAGGYDPAFRYAQDHDLWDRMMQIGPFLHLAEPLYEQLVHHVDSISRKFHAEQTRLSLAVSRRAFRRITGEALDDDDGLMLRRFWNRSPGVEHARVDQLMRSAADAYFRPPALAQLRPQLNELIAEQWLARANVTSALRPWAIGGALLRAAAWKPWLALSGPPRLMKVRLSRLARKGLSRVAPRG